MSTSANSSSSSRSSSRPPLYPLRRHQQQDTYASRSPSPPGPAQDPDPRDWSYRTNLIDPLTPDDASSSGSDDGSDDSDDYSTTTSQYIAEQEAQLREALEQLELALKVILCPLVGKWLGRRWAYWGASSSLIGHRDAGLTFPSPTAFKRYNAHGGLTLRFFGLSWVPETKIPSWLAVLALPITGGES